MDTTYIIPRNVNECVKFDFLKLIQLLPLAQTCERPNNMLLFLDSMIIFQNATKSCN